MQNKLMTWQILRGGLAGITFMLATGAVAELNIDALLSDAPPSTAVTEQLRNIAAMKRQLNAWGVGYDWPREVATCDPP